MAEWIGDQWRDLGPAALGLDPSDLELINLDSLDEMLDEFGTFNFSKSQAKALIKAAKKAWDESGESWFDHCLTFFRSIFSSKLVLWLTGSPLTWCHRDLTKPRRRLQRERRQTKGL